jgi:hypothetical protein
MERSKRVKESELNHQHIFFFVKRSVTELFLFHMSDCIGEGFCALTLNTPCFPPAAEITMHMFFKPY